MKRMIVFAISLLFFASVCFGQTCFGQTLEKKRHTWVLIPAFITAVGSWYMAKNPPVWYDKGLVSIEMNGVYVVGNKAHKNYAPAWVLGFMATFLTLIAITPVVEKDRVGFKKEIRF